MQAKSQPTNPHIQWSRRDCLDRLEANGGSMKDEIYTRLTIKILEGIMEERRSPGRKSIIDTMQNLNMAFDKLTNEIYMNSLKSYNDKFNADKFTRRYVYLHKYNLLRKLDKMKLQIEESINNSSYTDENTKIAPEPAWVDNYYRNCRRREKLDAQLRKKDSRNRKRILRNGKTDQMIKSNTVA